MRSQFSNLIRTISLAKKPLCLNSVSEKSVFWFSWQKYKTSNWHLMWLSFSWCASSCANDTKFIKKHNRFSMVRGLSNDSEICLSYIRQCKKSKYISGIHRISEVKIEKGFIFCFGCKIWSSCSPWSYKRWFYIFVLWFFHINFAYHCISYVVIVFI